MMSLVLTLALSAGPTEAERQFDEGRAAMKSGDLARACPAFEKSHQLEPALGVLLNLASCLEQRGQLASAWLRFNEATAWAQRTHEGERETFARQHAAALKPKLSWLSLSASAEVDVSVDGAAPLRVGPASPASVPVDAGQHVVSSRMPSAEPWSTTVKVERAATAFVSIPDPRPSLTSGTTALSPFNLPPPPPPPPLVVTHEESPRSAGLTLLISGVVVAGVGGVGLAWSGSTYGVLQGQRAGSPAPEIQVSRETLTQLQWIYPASWVATAVGAAATVTGVVLMVRGGPRVVVSSTLQPGGFGLSVSGVF